MTGQKYMHEKRDASIELWRIFCMLAIVLSHVANVNHAIEWGWFCWHVPGFLVISGYFGIRFSWSKVLKLVGISYGCYLLTMPFRPFPPSVISLVLPHGAWFLPFYIVLMVFSPILESALQNRATNKMVFVSAMALVVIGFVPSCVHNPHVGMLAIPGMQGPGMLLMVGTYIFGRWVRQVQGGVCATIMSYMFVPMVVIVWAMGHYCKVAGNYESPHVIFTAICGLCLFRRCFARLPKPVEKVVCFVSPSMFGVYLVHACCVPHWQVVAPGSAVSGVVMRALLLFVFGLVVDMLRRGIVSVVQRAWHHMREMK